MRNYLINEGTISIPEGWLDQSINLLSLPGNDPPECSLVVSRGKIEDGENLHGYVNRQMEMLQATLKGMDVIRSDETVLDGEPATDTEFTWAGNGVTFRQRQICVVRDDEVLSLTATVQGQLYVRHWNLLNEIIFSFKFRTP